jgi:transcriptional regulator with XRE-family HTH domain
METIGERLRYVIEIEEVNLYQFCKKNSLMYSTFNQIVLGNRNLGVNILYQILEIIPNLNINWLLLGIGEMRIVQKSNSEGELLIEEPLATYRKQDEFEKLLLSYFEKESVQMAVLRITKGEME